MPGRESAYGRLVRHFHTHPQGRLHEILFWSGLALLTGALAFFGWKNDKVNDPIALILAVIALCFLGFGLLPQKRPPTPPPPKGKRGEIAKQVKESKAEKKRGGPAPPHPPIRRG